jgi:hypothetical protein
MPEQITCPHCNGSGEIELTGVYAETLQTLRKLCKKQGRQVIAHQDAKHFGCEPTALSNRLRWLEDHDLAQSTRHGKIRMYQPTNH